MNNLLLLLVCLVILVPALSAQSKTEERSVIEAVKRFYSGFDDGMFPRAEEYTADDWVHVNPFGGRTVGRAATLKDLRAVHSSFLKGVTDTPESFDVKFVSSAVATVIVPSHLSSFTGPDGVRLENQKCIRTFVVVKKSGRWLISHDHNTFVR